MYACRSYADSIHGTDPLSFLSHWYNNGRSFLLEVVVLIIRDVDRRHFLCVRGHSSISRSPGCRAMVPETTGMLVFVFLAASGPQVMLTHSEDAAHVAKHVLPTRRINSQVVFFDERSGYTSCGSCANFDCHVKGKDGGLGSGWMDGPRQNNVVLSRDGGVGCAPSITTGADAYISFHVSSSSLILSFLLFCATAIDDAGLPRVKELSLCSPSITSMFVFLCFVGW